MKKYIIITQLVFALLLSGNLYAEMEASLPSEATWEQIENNAVINSSLEGNLHPGLRAAPPEGPSIGETPIGEIPLALLGVTAVIYACIGRRRKSYKPAI